MGGGIYQVPLIRKAKEMGIEAVVVSPKGKYPGISLADIFLDIDTTDADRIVIAAKEAKISGVVTTGTDVCVPSMGKVVDTLKLPGTGYAAACRSLDKVLMKRAFISRNVPTAAFEVFSQMAPAKEFADRLGYPIMVKTTDSSGSRGITKVNKTEEFKFAWNRAFSASRSKEIIVEQFLAGIEFGAQAFIHGNTVVAIFPHRDIVTSEPYFSPIGHSMPTRLTDEQQRKTAIVIERAVQALGLRDCVSNVDLMLVDNEPKIIEIGARMGATCLPEIISNYTGMDVYEHLIRLAMGEHPELNVVAKQATACLILRSDKTGIVTSLDVPDAVLKHSDLIDFHWDIFIGDPVRKFEVGPDRIGHLMVKGKSVMSAEALVQDLFDKIRVEVVEYD